MVTGDIVGGESGDRAMKLLITLLVLAGLAILGFIVVWWATYRQSSNEPFVMHRPPTVQRWASARTMPVTMPAMNRG